MSNAGSINRICHVYPSLEDICLSCIRKHGPSTPLEFHMPNKSLLAPLKNTFRTMKSLPDVTLCPLPGSSNEGALAGRSVLNRRGEIRKPPPLLCKSGPLSLQSGWCWRTTVRPTTFWRKMRCSGVTMASYSPSSCLVRWWAFIAAGLSQDTPRFDLPC